MNSSEAVEALSALAQEHRLSAFRLLVRAGPEGLAAGEIARQLAAPANTASTHLAILARAGLIDSQKSGRSVIYRVHAGGVRGLFEFLVSDCCAGQPDLCAPLSALTKSAVACAVEDGVQLRKRSKGGRI